jgi:cell shape-determining protein MreD
MTRARVAAAVAALLTVLVLQGALVGPLADTVPASLPAVLVAAIALVDGPGAGMAFGFAAGLITDLSSEHPAGLLAACWLGIGLLCGRLNAPNARMRHDVLVAAIVCGLATAASGVLLVVLGADGATLADAVRGVLPAIVLDGVLALLVVPLTRLFLRSDRLRAPRPVLILGGPE